MAIQVCRKRILVGLRKRDWTHVWYEPIVEGEELKEDEDFVPELGLYSESYGDSTSDDPLPGEVAWEPIFDPKYYASSKEKERNMMQKKTLWATWQYLMAKPNEVEQFRMELMEKEDPRSRAIERDARVARSRRSKAAQQTQARKRKRQRVQDVVDSIEAPGAGSESDPETELESHDSGHETDNRETGNPIREEGPATNSMPPPPLPRMQREGTGLTGTPNSRDTSASSGLFLTRGSQDSTAMMSGGLGSGPGGDGRAASAGQLLESQESGDAERSFKANSEMPAKSRGTPVYPKRTPDAYGRSKKRTPLSTKKRPRLEKGQNQRDHSLAASETETKNGGLGEENALRESQQMSEVPDNFASLNGGLDGEEAIQEAMRRSQMPEDGERKYAEAIQAAIRESMAPENAGSESRDLDGGEAPKAAIRRSMVPENPRSENGNLDGDNEPKAERSDDEAL